ncbi:MAG: ATP-binding protein [Saprospiraceae bacterium]
MSESKEITIKSELQSISQVEKLIDGLCQVYNIDEEHYGNILIALTEAVNNAIVHGNRLDIDKNVTLSYIASEKSLKFIVSDEGPGFDYDNLPDPTAPENIEKPHGRGVFLMKNLADQCSFLDDGRIVELEFEAVMA